MIAIDNEELIDPSTGIGMPPVNIELLAEGASFAFNSGASTLKVTDTSVVTMPDTFKNANVSVNDKQGGTVIGNIAASGGDTGDMDVSGLDLTGPLTLKITITTTKGVQADGEAPWVNASNHAGDFGNWLKNFSTNVGA